jgi:rhodanese-related sulfurtransferase
MTLPTISAENAKRLMDEGAILVDIREADEHSREKIPSAHHMPLSKLDEAYLAAHEGRPALFHCRSGARTLSHASRLRAKVDESCEASIVEGGIEAWKTAGLPVALDRRQPLELQRQVQIAAGSLGLLGTLLGLLLSPWYFVIPIFVGAGLITAGVTGFCGVTRLLMRAPWNRAVYGANAAPAATP